MFGEPRLTPASRHQTLLSTSDRTVFISRNARTLHTSLCGTKPVELSQTSAAGIKSVRISQPSAILLFQIQPRKSSDFTQTFQHLADRAQGSDFHRRPIPSISPTVRRIGFPPHSQLWTTLMTLIHQRDKLMNSFHTLWRHYGAMFKGFCPVSGGTTSKSRGKRSRELVSSCQHGYVLWLDHLSHRYVN